jgi:hypothetical protein
MLFAGETSVARSTLQHGKSFGFFGGAFEWKGQLACDVVLAAVIGTAPSAQ